MGQQDLRIHELVAEIEGSDIRLPSDPALWIVDEHDAFLAKRRELIASRLNAFLGHEKFEEAQAA